MNQRFIVSIMLFNIGVAIGFFGGKLRYEKYYSDLALEEIESVKEAFLKRQYDKDGACPMDVTNTQSQADNGLTDEEYEEKFRTAPNPLDRSRVGDNPYEAAKKNYNLIRREETVDFDRSQPYMIDEQTFLDEATNNYDKISLLYYPEEDLLCEDVGDVIEHIEASVGRTAIASLTHQKKVWVRNEPLSIDYEIVRIDLPYEEANRDAFEEGKREDNEK